MNGRSTLLLVVLLLGAGCGGFTAEGGDKDAGGGADRGADVSGADVRLGDAGTAFLDAPAEAGQDLGAGGGDGPDAAAPGGGDAAAPGGGDAAGDLAGPDVGAGDAVDARVEETFLVGIIDQARLVRVDPATGVTTPIGPLDLSNVFMVSFDPTRGKLFGIRESFSSPLLELVTVNPCTGAVTTVGPLHVATGTLNFVEGFAVNPASGVLYVTGSLTHLLPDSSSEALLTVDPTTALATFVASTNSPSGDVDNLLFVGDSLYATDVEGPTSNQTFLYKMNPATAAVSAVGTPSDPTQVYQLALDPRSGATYASDLKPAVHFGSANLTNNTYQPIAAVPGLGSIAFVTAACR